MKAGKGMYLSLHTADPKEHGLEATEVNCLGYERTCIEGIPFCFKDGGFKNMERVVLSELREDLQVTHFAIVDWHSGPAVIYSSNRLNNAPFVLAKGQCPVFQRQTINLDPIPVQGEPACQPNK